MISFDKKIPEYFVSKKNLTGHVWFTAAFAMVFLNIYSPFGVAKLSDKPLIVMGLIGLAVITGMVVIVISRVIMYRFSQKHGLTLGKYSIWIAAEVLSMATLFTLFDFFVLVDQRDPRWILGRTVQATTLVIMLPYVVYWLYISWKEKSLQLESFISGKRFFRSNNQDKVLDMVPFSDENGNIKVSLPLSKIIYIESADNYIIIYFVGDTEIEKVMIRNNLRKIQNEMEMFNIHRCHRSYLVNISKIKLAKNERGRFLLEMNNPFKGHIFVPVSKTYKNTIEECLQSF